MSLDIYLCYRYPGSAKKTFFRGRVMEMDPAETEVYHGHIDWAVIELAKEAGLFLPLWWPSEIGATKASHLVRYLEAGLHALRHDDARFSEKYRDREYRESLAQKVEVYIAACQSWPDATIRISA